MEIVEKACRNCAAGHVEPKAARAPSGKRAGSPRRPGAASRRLPDVSAATHERFRTKFDELVALVVERNIGALKSYKISPISSSPKARDKYRNLAVIALTGSVPLNSVALRAHAPLQLGARPPAPARPRDLISRTIALLRLGLPSS